MEGNFCRRTCTQFLRLPSANCDVISSAWVVVAIQVELVVRDTALRRIAQKALENETGARGLRAILVGQPYNLSFSSNFL